MNYALGVNDDGVVDVQTNENISVGDIVTLTTSTFEVDAITGEFTSPENMYTVRVDLDSAIYNFEDFESSKCSTGGAYGYATFKVAEILFEEVI